MGWSGSGGESVRHAIFSVVALVTCTACLTAGCGSMVYPQPGP